MEETINQRNHLGACSDNN